MTKMKRTLALVAAAAGITLAAGSAQAITSIDFVWNNTSTTTVTSPAASGFVTGSIILTGETTASGGAWLIVLTAEFDTNELDFVGAFEDSPAYAGAGTAMNPFVFLNPITAGVVADETNGIINQLDWNGSFTNLTGCGTGCVLTLGTIKFHVTNAGSPPSDRDVRLGLFSVGLDGIFTGTGVAIPTAFGDAAVTPEPTTALLLIGGLLGLGYAGRRTGR